MIANFYKNIIIPFHISVLLAVILAVIGLGTYSAKMEIDASADTLLLEHDKDLAFSRTISKRYATQDFLVVTFSPKDGNLLSEKSLITLGKLSDELLALDDVDTITSILNVPLLQSPPKPIKELLKDIPTLMSKDTNKKLAKAEFLSSPMYKENLVSNDFKTTALLVNLNNITTKEQNHQNITEIRTIVDKYRQNDTLNLGGVSMIADDLISFVKYDLETFSVVVFGLYL